MERQRWGFRGPRDVAGGLCGSRTGTFSFPCEGFWVELSSGLQRARQFVKAFSEPGGDLHTAQSQHREMILRSGSRRRTADRCWRRPEQHKHHQYKHFQKHQTKPKRYSTHLEVLVLLPCVCSSSLSPAKSASLEQCSTLKMAGFEPRLSTGTRIY
ncbi:hypothetical protein E1301_Tti011456 [Triplophysa tibetana]|uniref:Uncharacterized protein n=1 Tax=Triplophysa tibetana TaxID=1572043 RepID=A0A5A9PHV3_9TELE|nr:hypothetical protein E1301_Tti011456 [Triplophysa tibetana]